MKFSDEQVRDIVSLKEQILSQINEHQKQIDMLEKNLSVLDSILKQSSFTKASTLDKKTPQPEEKKPAEKSIPITKGSGGEVIANAYVTPEQVSIVLDENIGIDAETPPFKSFFLDRIIGEMKRKDSQEANVGNIPNESIINYVINKNGSNIREIIIKNYREKERINEIINTAGWSLTRMLENTRK